MIDRTEYLRRCQLASTLIDKIPHGEIPDSALVRYCGNNEYIKGTTFIPISYTISYNEKGEIRHGVTLQCMYANSQLQCTLTDVDEVKGEE